jgi:hypothetical protein
MSKRNRGGNISAFGDTQGDAAEWDDEADWESDNDSQNKRQRTDGKFKKNSHN